jgi:hypothetical protein
MGWVKERKMKELWQKGEDIGGWGGFISTLPGPLSGLLKVRHHDTIEAELQKNCDGFHI